MAETLKEKFLSELRAQVIDNVYAGNVYRSDLSQEEFDKIVTKLKINTTDAITWLFDSGLYVTDESHNGWFCPSIRQEIFLKHQDNF